jgi:hypothetical protein
MVYPYNAYLDEMVKSGQLQFCAKPDPSTHKMADKPVLLRSPITMSPDERLELSKRWGVTLNELTNMSPQEFAAAEAEHAKDAAVPEVSGLPQA